MGKKGLTASVTKHNVTMEDIGSFVKDNVVKFIFLDKQYSDISSDTAIDEIHKFKSVYRGNTYIRVPLKIVKGEDDKYARGIEVDTSDNPQGFAVVSKHDLRDLSPEMKKAKKDERVAFGEELCKKHINMLNKYLTNNVLKIVIKDIDGSVLDSRLVTGGKDFTTLNNEIREIVEEVNDSKTEII